LIILSQSNYSATKAFFKDNNYFGAGRSSFLFHTSGMLPKVDLDGKIIMKRTSEIQLSPSGSGALFESVSNSQKVKDLLKTVEYV
jgi:UDP-N-acetylglucosamine/UDP-N-acetylgalactosamine diphosphorylase